MATKIKIIQVIDQPSGGGAEKICRSIKRLLIEKKINTEVFYFKNPKKITLEPHETVYTGNAGYLGALLLLRKKIIQSLNSNFCKIIIQVHLTRSLYMVPIITLNLKCKMIFIEHNTSYRRRSFYFLRYLERIIYKRYDKIIGVSNACLNSLNNWLRTDNLKERMLVIYNGINLNENIIKTKKISKVIKFISIGSLTHQKGFDIAIKAMAKLDFNNWHYEILGEGTERTKLESLVKQLKLSKKILFKGYKDNVHTYLVNSDVMIIPSRWEGFGLVAVEALSFGIPLVVSKVPGIDEVVGNSEACIMFKSEDIKDLELSIQSAIKRRDKVLDLDKKAFLQASKFDETKMINNYLKIYNEV